MHFKEITDEKFVNLLAIGNFYQVVLFPMWVEGILPGDNFDASANKIYKNVAPQSFWACTGEEVEKELKKRQPLIVTTDIRFPHPYDDNSTQSGLEFVLRHRDLSPNSHYLFHGLEFNENDQAKLKEYGFDRYFIWKTESAAKTEIPHSYFPEEKAEKIFLKILRDYARQFTKTSS